MNEAKSQFVVPAYRRRIPGWKRFGFGAVAGALLFVGVLLLVVIGWGVVELVRSFSTSLIDAAAWGLFLSAVAGGVITTTEDW